MHLIPINAVGQLGIISPADIPPHELPLNAWSGGKNVRMTDGKVEKFLGHQQTFGTPGTAPYFALGFSKDEVQYWLYTSLTKAYAWNGVVHADVTRAVGGDYTALSTRNWTGGLIGGIPILNNGLDVPQMWNPVDMAQRLTALSNWDSNERCRAMRVFRRFLIAMDITKSGTRFHQMVKWSHPAPSGSVPGSWDETDATKDAGEYEIVDTDGAIVDGARMREEFILYKEDSVHRMQFVGGIDIFRFPPMFDSFGILSRRCAIEYAKGRHAVFALGNLISHDGVTWDSIVSSRMKKYIFDQIDNTNWPASYVTLNSARNEVWFCFPTHGNTVPNLALVWNWQYNTTGLRELAAAHIATGNVTLETGDSWDVDSQVWDEDPSLWGEGASNPSGKRLLICDPTGVKMHLGDSTNQFNGVDMNSYIERVSLPLPVSEDGPPDMVNRKFIADLFPRITGTLGATMKIHIGTQEVPEGPITWKAPRDFVIGVDRHVDVRVNTPLPAIRFEATGNFDWKLSGYQVRVGPAGRFR